MKNIALIICTLFTAFSFSQEKEQVAVLKKANNYIYEGNALVDEDDFVSAEMAYRKAISEQPTNVAGLYNLGNSYYEKGNFDEALFRHQLALKNAVSKDEKHKAFHNIGNILIKNEKCREAVEAYKSALRNDPTDDETRYNLGLAKVCAEQQKNQQDKDDENKDDDKKDDKEGDDKENEDKKDKEGADKDDKKDEGDKDDKEGDDKKEDKGKPKDDSKDKEDKDKEEGNNAEQQEQKPQQGQLSPQQIRSLLEAMNNQEKKVQEKMNAEKQKGEKIKTEKDW